MVCTLGSFGNKTRCYFARKQPSLSRITTREVNCRREHIAQEKKFFELLRATNGSKMELLFAVKKESKVTIIHYPSNTFILGTSGIDTKPKTAFLTGPKSIHRAKINPSGQNQSIGPKIIHQAQINPSGQNQSNRLKAIHWAESKNYSRRNWISMRNWILMR